MQPAQMKETVIEFLREFEDPDPAKLETMVADHFEYRVMTKMPGFETLKGKAGIRQFAGTIKTMLPNGLNMKLGPIICEGDHASVLAESDTVAANGRKYANMYSFYFRFAGDKIAEVREYCDTNHAREVFAA
ncbi:MAG: nuclear transport factor 2 family protein [Candidatus Binatus sp.]|uniref:nuclear transport factor 2 family protein n=1 Tax=Candidatus Binatus sp. TaxID=2811406 RepID=UPI0027161159|nr:nuclear transport factor 2 family protein [Candidatus Binatus sp.]MDO8434986.1 nuclear transport factor 2 family protein [Candidatus Binatus sp.]